MLKTEKLYNCHRKAMFTAAFRILKDKHLAEDAIHETFLKAAKHIALLDENDFFRTRNFLITACKNTAISMYNKNKSIPEDPCDNIEIYSPSTDVDDVVICEENIAEIKKIIMNLDEKERDVIILYMSEEYSIEKIAELLHISVAAAKKRLTRGRQKIKAKLIKEGIIYERTK